MHRVVTRLLVVAAMIAGTVAVAGHASADTAPQRPTAADSAGAGVYTALKPARLLDTRPNSALGPSATTTVVVAGRGGVPASGAGSVVLNVTAVTPASSGYLTVWPSGTKPVVSNLNFATGQTVANLVTVPVGSDGRIRIFNGSGGATNVLVDVSGWFTAATNPSAEGAFAPLNPPKRLLDTRASVAVPATGTRVLKVTGAFVPAAAGAVALTVTAVTPTAGGYITLYPGGTRPATSAVNFAAGRTVATAAAVQLASDGSLTIYNGSGRPLQVLVDAAGWFKGTTGNLASTFSFLPPARILDTRSGIGRNGTAGPLAGGATLVQPVGGAQGIPVKGVSAVVLTVTVTGGTGSGYLTVFPGATTKPTASTLNFAAGQTVTNLVVVPVTADDDQLLVSYYNGSGKPLSVIADVSAYVRLSDVVPPSPSTSRYVNDLLPTQSNAQIAATMQQHGCDDITAVTDDDDHFTLLEFGAQSNKAGNGSQDGVRLVGTPDPNNPVRLTYAQVVTAVKGYLDGLNSCRTETASGGYTVGVGTSSDGFAGSTYLPQDKGADWASEVVTPLVSYGQGVSVEVVGANDIEANFDATAAQAKLWVQSYLAGNSLSLVNNGSAAACPTVLGQTSRNCGAVRIDGTTTTQTWAQADYVALSYGLGPGRISALPQIYFPENAIQWQNINLTSGGRLQFAGVLTQVAACGTTPNCGDLSPSDAWTSMRQALDSDEGTDRTTLPTATDIRYDS